MTNLLPDTNKLYSLFSQVIVPFSTGIPSLNLMFMLQSIGLLSTTQRQIKFPRLSLRPPLKKPIKDFKGPSLQVSWAFSFSLVSQRPFTSLPLYVSPFVYDIFPIPVRICDNLVAPCNLTYPTYVKSSVLIIAYLSPLVILIQKIFIIYGFLQCGTTLQKIPSSSESYFHFPFI